MLAKYIKVVYLWINMFVPVTVRGNCYPYRDILAGTYHLKWDKSRKCYRGEMEIRGRKIANLEQFCNHFNLQMWVSGNPVNVAEEAEEDDFIQQKDFDDTQLGKIGGHQLPEELEATGFKTIQVTPMMKPQYEISDYFTNTRFGTPRQEQQQVIPEIAEAVKAGYKNIVVESPVGSGKSAMAMVVPKMFDSRAYVVTPLKGLQKQYLDEMPFMRSVMGKGNYGCSLSIEANCRSEAEAQKAWEAHQMGRPQQETTQADLAPCSTIGFKCGMKLPIKKQQVDWSVSEDKLCEYYQALHKAHHNRYFVGNTSYLMRMNSSGMYLLPRDFIIFDEAHTLPNTLADYYALTLSVKKLEMLLDIPSFNEIMAAPEANQNGMARKRENLLTTWHPVSSPMTWGFPKIGSIRTDTPKDRQVMGSKVWLMYLERLVSEISGRMKQYDEKTVRMAANTKNYLQRLIESLKTEPENIIWQYDDEEEPIFISFKPMDITDRSEELLLGLGKHRIFLSGTIADIDIYCQEMGLKKSETCYIQIKYSSFPVTNRPIFTAFKGGDLSRRGRREEHYRQTAERIVEIANQFPNQKGLILPYTDELEKKILEAVADVDRNVADRIITHSKNPTERDQVFENFNKSQGNQILVSTYANQGYDGGSVGFLVIPKLPFPSLGDVRIAKKLKDNPDWYTMQTGVMLTQMLGRIVRSPKDQGKMYIIDPSFDYHLRSQRDGGKPLKEFLPEYFNDAMQSQRQTKLY